MTESDGGELAFLGGSAMADRLRSHDWSGSALGPPARWPQSLRSVVNLMLGSAFPMFVGWGPSLLMLYNDACAELMGDQHSGDIGQPLSQKGSAIQDDLLPLLQRALGGEAVHTENLPLRLRRHGREEDTWLDLASSPVIDEQGRIAGVYCAGIETTRRVLAERRLHAREAWLQSLFDQAPGFAAVVRGDRHVFEMANPAFAQLVGDRPLLGLPMAAALPELAAQGFVALLDEVLRTGQPYVGRSMPVLLDGVPGRAGRQMFMDLLYQPLQDASGRLQGVFMQGHDVTEQHQAQLAFRRADRMALRKQVVTVGALAESALEAMRPLAQAKGHTLRLDLPEPGLLLAVDPVRIVQVLGHLLTNACKHTAAGGHIVLAAHRRAGWLCLSVTYDSSDIRAQPLPQLFSGFAQQASAIDGPANALGIALSLVEGIVQRHGGRVHAASEGPGRGHCVTVELPFDPSLQAAPPPAAAPAPETAAAAAGPARRVLVADDNRDACAGLAQLLSLMGHAVHTANDGEQAVALALAHQPEVLILDIGMPVLDGYEVARAVRGQPWGARPYLVAATGWGQDTDRRQAMEAGFDLHLTKPFDIRRLTELLARPLRA